jgi:hypothetical protein
VNYFDDVMTLILEWEPLGCRVAADGARLIGHVPHVAPEAYLHVVFPALDDEGIAQIAEQIGRSLPPDLEAFFRMANGIDLFSSSLCVDGLRGDYVRTDNDAWQPFSISLINLDERPPDADDCHVFFGGYNWDRSLLYLAPWSPKVYRCSPTTAEPLNEWPSLGHMLVSEVKRLALLFDRQGRKLDADQPTVP